MIMNVSRQMAKVGLPLIKVITVLKEKISGDHSNYKFILYI